MSLELDRENVAERDKILNIITDEKNFGGVHYYTGLDVESLQKLVDLHFALPNDNQNDAPTIGEFIEFMKEFPRFKAHGYAVVPERDDYRVSVEGLSFSANGGEPLTKKEMIAFMAFNGTADEFRIYPDHARSWYD